MNELNMKEVRIVSGGLSCNAQGQPCSGCANVIHIDGDDCSIILGYDSVKQGSFDTGGLVMGAAATWVGAVAAYGAAAAFGLGGIASGGVGIVVGLAISVAYATTNSS
jgi:hypothetical protein